MAIHHGSLKLPAGATKAQSRQHLAGQLSEEGAQNEASQKGRGDDEIGSQGKTNVARDIDEENGQHRYGHEESCGKGAGGATALLGKRSEALLPGKALRWRKPWNPD